MDTEPKAAAKQSAHTTQQKKSVFGSGSRNGIMRYLVTLVLILIPVGVIYYLHVRDQTNYHQERAFRALSEVGQLLENNLQSFAQLPATIRTGSKIKATEEEIQNTRAARKSAFKDLQDSLRLQSRLSSTLNASDQNKEYTDKELEIQELAAKHKAAEATVSTKKQAYDTAKKERDSIETNPPAQSDKIRALQEKSQ